MITYPESRAGYINLWNKANVRPQYKNAATHLAAAIGSAGYRGHYDAVEQATKVPWFIVGLWHMRESSFNFATYLGNGQPLNMVTTIAPRGRGPFPSFQAGAVDALRLNGFAGIENWPISFCLWASEKWNGQGYFLTGINSPYVWSWTDLYSRGKYDYDGHYNGGLVDPQPGVAAVLKELLAVNADVAAYFKAHPEDHAVTTTTTVPTPAPAPTAPVTVALPQISIAQIITFLDSAQKILPLIGNFIPQPWGSVVQGAVPAIESILEIIEKLQGGENILQVLAEGLQTLSSQLQAINAAASAAAATTAKPTGT